MSIVIENPTAETIYAALREVPHEEIARLRAMLNAEAHTETAEEEESAWRAASVCSATRFFEEEEA